MKNHLGYGIEVSLETRLRVRLLAGYAQSVWKTARYAVQGEEHIWPKAQGQPTILASWHGSTLAVLGHYIPAAPPNRVALVSDDMKGWVVGLWLRTLGCQAVPISVRTKSLAAGRRLVQLVQQLRSGMNLLMNPDGPHGPAGVPKEGLYWIAKKTGARILPGGAFCGTSYRLPRWDRYLLPLPFSRIAVCYGTPLEVRGDEEPRAALARIRDAIDAAELRARRLYHGEG